MRGVENERLGLDTAALAILSGIALSTAAEAVPYGRRYGDFTPHERAAIARSAGNIALDLHHRI